MIPFSLHPVRMNFPWYHHWTVNTPPDVGSSVDLTPYLQPSRLIFPVTEGITVERTFVGGTVRHLLQQIYTLYQQPVDSSMLEWYISRVSSPEVARLQRFQHHLEKGKAVTRLDVLGQPAPLFLGIHQGIVLLGP
jgi:hypothetical protein